MEDITLQLARKIDELERELSHLKTAEHGRWHYLQTPLTSTAWDGDAHSTEAKTLIDLSAVFGVPAGVKAVDIRIQVWDSGSAAASSNWFGVSPNSTAGSLMVVGRCQTLANDTRGEGRGSCACDANGDIYYQCAATGAGTMKTDLQIWGYMI